MRTYHLPWAYNSYHDLALPNNLIYSFENIFDHSPQLFKKLTTHYDTEGNLVLSALMPGLEKDQIKISLENNWFIITGKNDSYSYEYTQSVDMNKYMFPETAKLENGVLTITFTRKYPADNVKHEIKIT